jgi:hypothetical protein
MFSKDLLGAEVGMFEAWEVEDIKGFDVGRKIVVISLYEIINGVA